MLEGEIIGAGTYDAQRKGKDGTQSKKRVRL